VPKVPQIQLQATKQDLMKNYSSKAEEHILEKKNSYKDLAQDL
jgi:hypothetical protein